MFAMVTIHLGLYVTLHFVSVVKLWRVVCDVTTPDISSHNLRKTPEFYFGDNNVGRVNKMCGQNSEFWR
jgi:hypothetical protein